MELVYASANFLKASGLILKVVHPSMETAPRL